MSADSQSQTPTAPDPWWNRLTRPKGNLRPVDIGFLLFIGGFPLIMVLSRVLAYPGAEPAAIPGFDMLRQMGETLNTWLSLAWVPPSDRSAILYLLLLPTGAMLIVLARLTFGLRVLGLRAILISIGFQESGLVPSLILIALVVGMIVAIRPSMRRIRLPLYARISVILCLAALTMISALLIAPWVRSEAVWGVAFFPVIIVAMMAEGIAKTVANDNAVLAAWRAIWTLVLALVMAGISQLTVVREVAIGFPELMITQLVAIVFIAEYLDLRLLEHWPDRLHRRAKGVQNWRTEKPRVAVVRNRWNNGVIGRLNRPAPSKYRRRSIQRLIDGLRGLGYKVRVFEADINLLRGLQDFIPQNPRTGKPGGVVLNLATGTQGTGRLQQAPAMLEMAGVAYTGPDPVAQARLADRFALMSLLRDANLPVPRFAIVYNRQGAFDPPFPVAARPRCEPDAARKRVTDAKTLAAAVEKIGKRWGQETFVEEVLNGRKFRVALIGNDDDIECLPLLEYRGRNRTCPAVVEAKLADRICDYAVSAFRVAGCRDYARVDICITDDNQPRITGVRWADTLALRGSFAQAAKAAGYDYAHLIGRIVEVTAQRYEIAAGDRPGRRHTGTRAVVSLAERREPPSSASGIPHGQGTG